LLPGREFHAYRAIWPTDDDCRRRARRCFLDLSLVAPAFWRYYFSIASIVSLLATADAADTDMLLRALHAPPHDD